jgi:hypothetical protein
MRETAANQEKELETLTVFCNRFGSTPRKLASIYSSNQSRKYRIDAVILNGSEIKAWAEVKNYSKSGFLGLNIVKYKEGTDLARLTGLPFLMVVSIAGKVGWLKLHDGLVFCAPPDYKLAGGTPRGQEPLHDDIEPMAMFSEDFVQWI